jgi:hypothetical protein
MNKRHKVLKMGNIEKSERAKEKRGKNKRHNGRRRAKIRAKDAVVLPCLLREAQGQPIPTFPATQRAG